jgi:hypothetical protein
MAVKFTKPEINVREKLAELDKPSGIAGEAMLRAETPQEQFNLIGAGRRNIIINGAMQVAQRGTSATTIASNTYDTCDRFMQEFPPASWSVNSTQEEDGPPGFDYSLKLAATSGATLGASEYMIPFEYRTEGYDASRLGWGTTEAKDVTLSFWIKSNRTGIYTVDFTMQGGGTNPFIARQYTINSANTWEYKTITIPAHTTATNVKIDNTNAFSLFWWALSGSTFNSGEIVKGWGVQTPANRAPGTSATIASGDYWQMTGVQMEVGKVATPFEHRLYGEELALCQRYYQKSYDTDAYITGSTSLSSVGSVDHYGSSDATNVLAQVYFRTQMRDAPTVVTFDPNSSNGGNAHSGRAYITSNSGSASYNTTTNNIGTTGFRSYVPKNGAAWAAHRLIFQWQAAAEI